MNTLQAFSRATGQLPDPRLRRVLLIGIAVSLAVFVLLWIALGFAVAQVEWTALPLIGGVVEWMGEVFDWLAGALFVTTILLLTLVLFPAVVTIVVGFFLEDVVAAVEHRHYPDLPAPRPQPMVEVLASTVKFAAIVIAVNLLFLPVYLLLFFLPPLNLILYYLVNGYLVSREYFELVAFRRADPGRAKALRRAHRGRLMAAGALIVFVMTIPIVNFITPVLATAFMVHVFQNLPRRRELVPGSGP